MTEIVTDNKGIINTNDCMLYALGKSARGYGYIWVGMENGGQKLIYRAVYEAIYGKIPNGLEIDHLCRTPPCFNIDHLEVVTKSENVIRMYGHGLCKKGHTLEGNVYINHNTKNGDTYRMCRICSKERSRIRHKLSKLAKGDE